MAPQLLDPGTLCPTNWPSHFLPFLRLVHMFSIFLENLHTCILDIIWKFNTILSLYLYFHGGIPCMYVFWVVWIMKERYCIWEFSDVAFYEGNNMLSALAKYVINRLIHGLFHIALVISPGLILSLGLKPSGRYQGLVLITKAIWKRPCINL